MALMRPSGLDELAELPAGIVPVVGTVDVAGLASACEVRGRQLLVLSTTGVADRTAFMDAVGAALSLPGWFGRSWDALAECVADLADGTVLLWDGWADMARAVPRDTELAIEVLADSALTVLLVDAPADAPADDDAQ